MGDRRLKGQTTDSSLKAREIIRIWTKRAWSYSLISLVVIWLHIPIQCCNIGTMLRPFETMSQQCCVKGDVTQYDSQRPFLAQHKAWECWNNVVTIQNDWRRKKVSPLALHNFKEYCDSFGCKLEKYTTRNIIMSIFLNLIPRIFLTKFTFIFN